jgi:hypothetical protein
MTTIMTNPLFNYFITQNNTAYLFKEITIDNIIVDIIFTRSINIPNQYCVILEDSKHAVKLNLIYEESDLKTSEDFDKFMNNLKNRLSNLKFNKKRSLFYGPTNIECYLERELKEFKTFNMPKCYLCSDYTSLECISCKVNAYIFVWFVHKNIKNVPNAKMNYM